LDGAKCLQHRPRGQSRRQDAQALLQDHRQAIGNECVEDVGLDDLPPEKWTPVYAL
jgi:hypothetical protein